MMHWRQGRPKSKPGTSAAQRAAPGIEGLFGDAVRHHQAGRLGEAERGYRQILAAFPRHADSLHLLGVIAYQVGRHDAAVELIGKAIAVDAGVAPYHTNLGNALMEQGRLDEAIARHSEALRLQPDYVQALANLGNALQRRGRLDDAIARYAQALRIKPDYDQALNNLGLALQKQGRLDEAVARFAEAVRLRPDHPEFLYNFGLALQEQGRIDDAVARYRQALRIKPDYHQALSNLGLALQEQGKLDEAVACCAQALRIKPDSHQALTNLGLALQEQGKLDDAILRYVQALRIKPDHPAALYNLGNALQEQGRLDEAIARYAEALRIEPDYYQALTNLGNALTGQGKLDDAIARYTQAVRIKPDYAEAHFNLGLALAKLSLPDEAAGALRRALAIKPDYLEALSVLTELRQQCCDWEGREAGIARILDFSSHGATISPFLALAHSTSPELHLACARRWAEKDCGGTAQRFAHMRPVAERRIRLGYLSADFRTHPVAFQVIETIERHDRSRFEVVGYSIGADDGSEIRRRLEQGFDRFVDLRALPDAEATGRIHADGIDILVDLNGYTRDSRTKILAARPAPIQVNWLGYPGTMGADFMDYIIADAFAVPPEQQPFFTEKLVHLPHCFMPNDTVRPIAETAPTRAECGLPEGAFVFCSFNNSYKITPRFFALWMDLLAALPGSLLWLRGDETVKRNLSREASVRGVDPARLVFAPQLPMDEHLARYRQADLFLDTLPYNAHATTCDALWAGLPVLTLAGTCFPGRVAGSLLRAVGLPELVTTSEDEYRALALRLAREPALLKQYRQRLAENRETAPLFDTGRFTRDIEAAYERMWQDWRGGGA